jgi:hypothetical protein
MQGQKWLRMSLFISNMQQTKFDKLNLTQYKKPWINMTLREWRGILEATWISLSLSDTLANNLFY